MSGYENVVAGKLRLKGKPLDVKAGGVAKRKKHRNNLEQIFTHSNASGLVEINAENQVDASNKVDAGYDTRLTPAERRYLEQWKQLEVRRLLKNAKESHRDKVQKFNQYLANLSEHYDIPKVGPG